MVGGFVAAGAPGPAFAAALPVGRVPAPSPLALASEMQHPTDVAGTPADRARFALPVGDQAFETTRLDAGPPATGPASAIGVPAAIDLVRSARVASGEAGFGERGTPALRPGDRIAVSVSFYYCETGGRTLARGDGGGFCGAMRDGSVVYNGAAACDFVYLGQRFRIDGDPLGLIYRCADTGSAVHGLHRDVWFASSDDGWAWQRSVGQAATIEILP